MGVQACRLPAPKPLKRSKPSKPSKRSKPSQPSKRQNPCNLQPTGVQRLASNAGHSDPTARSIASSKAARPSQPTGVPRPHPWLLMGVQACRLPAPKPLKRSKPSKHSKPSQPPKRQNPCNLQPTGVQRLASNAGHSDPTARSIASSKAARPSQPTGVPRPHPWLLMGVQACRLPAPKPLKRSKPSKPSKRSKPSQPPKRQNPCNLQPTGVQTLASNAGHSDPTVRSIAGTLETPQTLETRKTVRYSIFLVITSSATFPLSGANVNIRFVLHNAVPHRKLVPTHRSLVYLPCLPVTGHIPFASGATLNILFRNDLRVPHLETVTVFAPVIYLACASTCCHINGFLWAPLGVQACRLLLFSFTTPSFTENCFPHTVRWSIFPVFTSLATFPLHAGQT